MSESLGRELGKRILNSVRGYVARSIAPVISKLQELDRQVKAIKPERGEKGDRGEAGPQGLPGPQGRDGATGRDGRDASDLKVIEKLVAEQMDAQVNALLSSFKVSSPDEGRTLVFEASVGEKSLKTEIRTGLVLDRGVYRPENKYLKGDSVSFGGSGWIAQVDEPTEKPGVPPAGAPSDYKGQWRLAVKKGRDGKDAK